MMIYLLFACTIIMFIFAFFMSNEDILAPSVIVCMMWMFSTLCAIYNIDNWGINFHLNTIGVIALGLSAFIIGGGIGKLTQPVKFLIVGKEKQRFEERTSLSIIPVWKLALMGLILVNIVTVLYQLQWVLSRVGIIGIWSEMMTIYRSGSTSWSIDSVRKPSLLSNLETLLSVTAFIMSYIGINNIFAGQKKTKTIVYFIPALLLVIDKILNAGRVGILEFIGALVLSGYINMQIKYSWKKKVGRKYIKYMLVAFVVVLFLFSISRTWVGRTNKSGTLEYVTMYAGGSVQLFDLYMQNPEPGSDIFGKETFHTLINYLGRLLNKSDWRYLTQLEFRSSNGVNLGNVYGAFRYYLYDFGYIGLMVLSAFVGFFYTYIYRRIQQRKKISKDGFCWMIIVYMRFAPSLFMFSIADKTYALLVDVVALIKWFGLAWIIKRLLVNRRFPIKYWHYY